MNLGTILCTLKTTPACGPPDPGPTKSSDFVGGSRRGTEPATVLQGTAQNKSSYRRRPVSIAPQGHIYHYFGICVRHPSTGGELKNAPGGHFLFYGQFFAVDINIDCAAFANGARQNQVCDFIFDRRCYQAL